MTHKYIAVQNTRNTLTIAPSQGARSQTITNGAMLCCGCATIEGFGSISFADWKAKADYLQALYEMNRVRHYIYIVNDAQRGGDGYGSAQEHKLLEEIGAKCVTSFPNWNHGGRHNVHLYLVDVEGAKGLYLNNNGEAFAEDPKLAEKLAAEKRAKEKADAEALAKLKEIEAQIKAGILVPYKKAKTGDTVVVTDLTVKWKHWDGTGRVKPPLNTVGTIVDYYMEHSDGPYVQVRELGPKRTTYAVPLGAVSVLSDEAKTKTSVTKKETAPSF